MGGIVHTSTQKSEKAAVLSYLCVRNPTWFIDGFELGLSVRVVSEVLNPDVGDPRLSGFSPIFSGTSIELFQKRISLGFCWLAGQRRPRFRSRYAFDVRYLYERNPRTVPQNSEPAAADRARKVA